MTWLIAPGLLAITVLAAVTLVVRARQRAFVARVAQEMRALRGVPRTNRERSPSVTLPDLVARYRSLAIGDRSAVRTVLLRHRGTFRMRPTSRPRPIEGVQAFTADPPGFVWHGRVRVCPGLWIDARDMMANGKGSMRVLVDDCVTLADARGPDLDQGSALRLLAELVWMPTSLFDPSIVTWDAIDATHARATLHAHDLDVECIFQFGADGLPAKVTAQRIDDKGVLRPWGGTYRDWRTVAGMLVPFEAEVSWLTPKHLYAHWRVDSIEYDGDLPPVEAVAPVGPLARLAIILELVLGVSAIGGGLALMAGPRGEIIPLPLAALATSPFATYFWPGAILFTVLGVGSLVAAVVAWQRRATAPFLTFTVGCALLIWIAVEIAIVGYASDPPLQLLYLVLGIWLVLVGGAWFRTTALTPMRSSTFALADGAPAQAPR